MVIRLGPPDIRDPDLRSRATHIQRARLTHAGWSGQPGRILYLAGLTDAEPGEPPAISLELEAREAKALYEAIGAQLRQVGYVP